MSNMMYAIRSGCFTDYFLSPATVIRIMEAIAVTETDARRAMLTVEAPKLLGFLALADDGAARQVRAWGIDLADFSDSVKDDTVENFLSWFHNMQAIRDSGELDEFTSHGYITFELS
jgi:hypothetical protein